MNLSTLMKIGDNITPSSGMGERAAVGLEVVLIGMGVVFGVLILLIAILYLFKLVFDKNNTEKSDKPVEVAPVTPVTTVSAPTVASSAPVGGSDEEQIVAIATAAIAAARGESECAFNVISIKKIVK